MVPYQIVCTNCGTPRVGRKLQPDAEVIPYQDTCSECGCENFDVGGRLEVNERNDSRCGDFVTALGAQQQRVMVALETEKSINAAPIVRDEETLSCEEYVTLVYELHHVHLPELQTAGVVDFDRREDTVMRGPRFNDICLLINCDDDR